MQSNNLKILIILFISLSASANDLFSFANKKEAEIPTCKVSTNIHENNQKLEHTTSVYNPEGKMIKQFSLEDNDGVLSAYSAYLDIATQKDKDVIISKQEITLFKLSLNKVISCFEIMTSLSF